MWHYSTTVLYMTMFSIVLQEQRQSHLEAVKYFTLFQVTNNWHCNFIGSKVLRVYRYDLSAMSKLKKTKIQMENNVIKQKQQQSQL